MSFSFEKLDVYKKAIDFANDIYKLTKDFPASEIYGLTSQIRRASVSVASNIAEGSGRYHKRDFIQFLRVARGSLYECVSLLEVVFKQGYIENKSYKDLINRCNELAKMINGLISSLNNSVNSQL